MYLPETKGVKIVYAKLRLYLISAWRLLPLEHAVYLPDTKGIKNCIYYGTAVLDQCLKVVALAELSLLSVNGTFQIYSPDLSYFYYGQHHV